MVMSFDGLEVRVEREHGIHQYETLDGMQVTGISAPSWEDCEAALQTLPTTDGYVVTPELITSPVPLDEIASLHAEVLQRIRTVREISQRHLWTRFLLGTALFNEFEPRPTNSVVALMTGREIGRQHKRGASWGEAEHLHVSYDHVDGRAVDKPSHSVLVCAELGAAAALGPPDIRQRTHARVKADQLIPPETRTIIAMSCWGVPRHEGDTPEVVEAICGDVLGHAVTNIFEFYPNVQELIMVDRAIPEIGTQPFNFHAQRRQS